MYLQAGSPARVQVSGTWQNAGDSQRWGPQGYHGIAKSGYPVPGAKEFALVAKVGDVTFEVGRGRTLSAPVTGEIEFCMNDKTGSSFDNRGSVKVTVEIID